jgi:hypothetical protein
MQTRTQTLNCRKCGATGVLEYEQSGTFQKIKCISVTGGFTFHDAEALRAARVICRCGELVFYARYL